jgi:hypothetical protein
MARKFNPYPVTNHGKRDERYQISLEYCGYEHPMFTARFCDDELIGRSRFYSSAVMLASGHNAQRNGAMIIEAMGELA